MKRTTYSIQDISEKLFSAVICDALDGLGYHHGAIRLPFRAYTNVHKLVGRCKTTLWADMFHQDPEPYKLELKAVDECVPGDVLIAAAGGSQRSGIWGELLSTAALNGGCTGAVIHGAVRDIDQMRKMGFPVFATGTCPYDSLNRQRVIDLDIPVKIDGVVIEPGSLIFCDEDGIVVVPLELEMAAIEHAMKKVAEENMVRKEIRKGMKASEAYQKYGIL